MKLKPPRSPAVVLTPPRMPRVDPEEVRTALGAEEMRAQIARLTPKTMLRLVNCTSCEDVFRPNVNERRCSCGRTRARELENERLGVGGPCRVLAIPYEDYDRARPGDYGLWVILPDSDQIVRGAL